MTSNEIFNEAERRQLDEKAEYARKARLMDAEALVYASCGQGGMANQCRKTAHAYRLLALKCVGTANLIASLNQRNRELV